MQIAAREIVLWTTPSEPPKALQASECSELLDPMRASCLILAQHQPGKFRGGCCQNPMSPKKLCLSSAPLFVAGSDDDSKFDHFLDHFWPFFGFANFSKNKSSSKSWCFNKIFKKMFKNGQTNCPFFGPFLAIFWICKFSTKKKVVANHGVSIKFSKKCSKMVQKMSHFWILQFFFKKTTTK